MVILKIDSVDGYYPLCFLLLQNYISEFAPILMFFEMMLHKSYLLQFQYIDDHLKHIYILIIEQ